MQQGSTIGLGASELLWGTGIPCGVTSLAGYTGADKVAVKNEAPGTMSPGGGRADSKRWGRLADWTLRGTGVQGGSTAGASAWKREKGSGQERRFQGETGSAEAERRGPECCFPERTLAGGG